MKEKFDILLDKLARQVIDYWKDNFDLLNSVDKVFNEYDFTEEDIKVLEEHYKEEDYDDINDLLQGYLWEDLYYRVGNNN